MECEFSGIPIPSTVDWTRNGVRVTNGIVLGSNTSRLSIPSLNESAIYQCHVENKYGRDSRTVFLCAVEQEGREGCMCMKERERGREGGRGRERERGRKEGGRERGVDGVNYVCYLHVVV